MNLYGLSVTMRFDRPGIIPSSFRAIYVCNASESSVLKSKVELMLFKISMIDSFSCISIIIGKVLCVSQQVTKLRNGDVQVSLGKSLKIILNGSSNATSCGSYRTARNR